MKELLLRLVAGLLALVVLLSLAGSQVNAQVKTGEIRGSVSETGRAEVLIGANVFMVGTSLGASTNLEGQYIIKQVPPGTYTVRARYVGYKELSREVKVVAGETATLDFALVATAVQLGEVVVTGQGVATEKKRLPSVVESISSKDIDLSPAKSVDQLLQGRVPGLMAYSPGGAPGSSARIMTRGIKSALGQPTPVIYVDGVRVDNNLQGRLSNATGGQLSSSISDILSGDIDHIEVIKGGAAATLYGAEAANGVIQVFTKKGVPGAIRWSANVTSGTDVEPMKDWSSDMTKDKFFRTGMYQGYRLGAIGGSDVITYNVSGKMSENKGVVTQDALSEKLYNLSTGLRVVVSDLASVEVSASYTHDQYGVLSNDNSSQSLLSNLEIEGAFDLLNNQAAKDSLFNQHLLGEWKENINRWIFSTNFTYTPLAWWDNKVTLGVDYRKNENRQFVPIEQGAFWGTVGGLLSRSDREYKTITMNYTATFKVPDVGPVTQRVIVGAQGFRIDDREVNGTGTTFRIPGTQLFNNASVVTALESNRELFSYGYLAQDQIGLWNKLFFDVGVRFDGNSTFGTAIGIQTYPKVGVAYNVSEESFYPDMLKPYLGSFKVRASWGKTGTFPPPFTRDRTFLSNIFFNESALTFGNPGNTSLKPENTTSIDAGFDAGLLDDRISVEFSWYRQITKDAMFTVTEDPAAGLGTQRRNVGEIFNEGFEISARAVVLDNEDLQLNLRGFYTTLKNRVNSLGGAAPFTVAGFSFAPQRVEEGKEVGIIRVSKPRLEADGVYRGKFDTVYVGSPVPKNTISFGADVTIFKDLTISGLFEGAWGHFILNQSLSRRIVNGLANPALYPTETALVPKVEAGSTPYNRNSASAVLVEPGDWFKIREISVRYRVPRSIIGGLVNGLSVTASVRNVASFGIKVTNIDPETSFIPSTTIEVGGIAGATVESPRQYRLGLDFNF
ncbi:MAG: TonB-dependent receptor [Ignavibacteriales bacterium]|nr:TonB-dependent receptor [Ignavibacteriales bacterium]